MTEAPLALEPLLCPVSEGEGPGVLSGIRQPGVELALWRRGVGASRDPGTLTLATWLATLPEALLPRCQLELQPTDALARLQAAFDASGTPLGTMQQALLHDINLLVVQFAQIVGCASVRLRLDAISTDACMRWHRDCVPLRLITTYRGPGTEWLPPAQAAAALAQPDQNMGGSEQLAPFDVALFKGCGWPGLAHDSGIVHRSPRIADRGITRLVLVLNPPFNFHWELRA